MSLPLVERECAGISAIWIIGGKLLSLSFPFCHMRILGLSCRVVVKVRCKINGRFSILPSILGLSSHSCYSFMFKERERETFWKCFA